MNSWLLFPTEQYTRDLKQYAKKHPYEYVAIAANLGTYYDTLKNVNNPLQVKSGFIHKESDGIKAIDRKGGYKKVKPAETRLYIHPDVETKTLYLLKIGDKNSQKKDMRYCREHVKKIRKGASNAKKI